MMCFSLLHNATDCNLTKAFCKAVMSSGPNKGQICGKKHHKSLHSEKRNRYGKGNSSQQTQASGGGKETTHPGGASGAGTS